MGLWKIVRREVAGALRSARYDVHRRQGLHRAEKLLHADTHEIRPVRIGAAKPAQAEGRHRPSPARRPARPIPVLPGNPAHPKIQARPGGLTPAFEDRPKALPAVVRPVRKKHRAVLKTSGVAALVAGGAAGTYLAIVSGFAGHPAAPMQDTGVPPVAAPLQTKAQVVPSTNDEAGPTTARKAPLRGPNQAPYEVHDSYDVPGLPVPAPATPTTRGPEETPAPTASPSSSPSSSPSASPSMSPSSPSASASSQESPPDHSHGRHHHRPMGQTGEGH